MVVGTSMAGAGRTGYPEQDLGCGEANSPAQSCSQHPAGSKLLWGVVPRGGTRPWVCSEMFYSGCLSPKERFPFRLNYLDSVYSKHRRQDSSISSFRKYG